MQKDLLARWKSKKLITEKQRKQLEEDWSDYDQDRRGSRFVSTLAVIGALLLGLAAIVFVSANWQTLPSIAKVILMVTLTSAALIFGYLLRDHYENFPKIGSALIFLSTLLWGATIAVSAQAYNISASGHWLLLVWLLGVAPVGYLFTIVASQVLSVALFIGWLCWLLFENSQAQIAAAILAFLPILLFVGGSWHYKIREGESAGKFMRYVSLGLATIALFVFGFVNDVFRELIPPTYYAKYLTFVISACLIGVACLIFALIQWNKNPTGKEGVGYEAAAIAALSVGVLLHVLLLPALLTVVSHIVINSIAHALIIFLIIVLFKLGYQREDLGLINFSILVLAAYILFAYADLFYDLIELSLLLLIGGALLLGVGFFLEKKRRDIKAKLIK